MTDPAWFLGQTSEKHEVGRAGAGQISHTQGDHGGTSYGTPQFSVKTGSLAEYLRHSLYGKQFAGMAPDTQAFNAKWKEIARTDPNFGKDQHEYAGKAMYNVQVERLKRDGLDLTQRGPAVQDALWSTSVQYQNLTKGIFEHALVEKYGENYHLPDLSDKNIVTAVQDYKYVHTERLFVSSPELWGSLRQRALDEKTDLVRLADGRNLAPARREPSDIPHQARPREYSLHQGAVGSAVHDLQSSLAGLGYLEAKGVDSDFGIKTRHAVERFQHDHHLTADGKVGSLTQQALHAAQQQHAKTHDLNDPKNPDYALFEQALTGVHSLDKHGHPNDRQRLNLAASLAVEAIQKGMTRIDQVTLGDDGSRVYIAQHPTSPMGMMKLGSVDTVTALQTPMARSSAMAASVPSPSIAPQSPVIQPSTPAHALAL